MKIALSSICRGHMYALARELQQRGSLAAVYSGYARQMLKREVLGSATVFTFPWVHMPYMAARRLGLLSSWSEEVVLRADYASYERFVARHLVEADIFHGLSCHNLQPGLLTQRRGGHYICDRGSSHIKYQDRVMREESERTGIPVRPVDPAVIAREQREYAACDRIFVPSSFALRTFVAQGIAREKLWSFPYGVDLSRWRRVAKLENQKFRIVYLGSLTLRKGIHDLLLAFHRAALPDAELVLIGTHSSETTALLQSAPLQNVVLTGPLKHADVLSWLSRSSVFVLASIEDGFGLVLLEAMACGLPVIATENTGGPDIIVEGQNGFVVPIRSPDSIAERLVALYQDRTYLAEMSDAALRSAERVKGWTSFADQMIARYRDLVGVPAA